MRGLVAPEAAATASAVGSFVPMLTLGVPGSGTTAVMMGALTLYNITPGPVLFDSKPELVWGLIASLFVANVLLFIMNVPMVRLFSKVLSVPGWLMVPGILCISYIGVYAINAGTFDLCWWPASARWATSCASSACRWRRWCWAWCWAT